jgi:hypothetical protein
MKLANDTELANTRRKLDALEKLIQKSEQSRSSASAQDLSLESMRRFARKLRREIIEYENSHQTTR